MIGYAVRNQKPGEGFVEILLQPQRYYKPANIRNRENKEVEADAESKKLEERVQELENIIFQLSNDK